MFNRDNIKTIKNEYNSLKHYLKFEFSIQKKFLLFCIIVVALVQTYSVLVLANKPIFDITEMVRVHMTKRIIMPMSTIILSLVIGGFYLRNRKLLFSEESKFYFLTTLKVRTILLVRIVIAFIQLNTLILTSLIIGGIGKKVVDHFQSGSYIQFKDYDAHINYVYKTDYYYSFTPHLIWEHVVSSNIFMVITLVVGMFLLVTIGAFMRNNALMTTINYFLYILTVFFILVIHSYQEPIMYELFVEYPSYYTAIVSLFILSVIFFMLSYLTIKQIKNRIDFS